MGKEGLATQDRFAGADTGMIIAKDVAGSIEEDAFFFPGELFIDADPFHFFTSAGRLWSIAWEKDEMLIEEYQTMLAKAVPEITARINLLFFRRKSTNATTRCSAKGYDTSYTPSGLPPRSCADCRFLAG